MREQSEFLSTEQVQREQPEASRLEGRRGRSRPHRTPCALLMFELIFQDSEERSFKLHFKGPNPFQPLLLPSQTPK